MLVRVSLVLLAPLAFAGVWLWWDRASEPREPPPTPEWIHAARVRAHKLFAQGVALKADARQARERFRQAADAFQELANLQPSPAAFQDLGAAALLGGRLPQAIVAFHQGLRLAPDDAALRERLRYARALVPQNSAERNEPFGDAWPLWLPTPPSLLRYGALVCYALAFFLVTMTLTRQRPRFLAWACAFLILTLGQLLAARLLRDDRPLVVIAAEDVQLRLGNGASYPVVPGAAYLPPGTEARELARRGGWLLIDAPGGVGWVPLEASYQRVKAVSK